MTAAKPLKFRPLLARDVQCYRVCEDFTEALIYLMAVFSPWAFGTTTDWAMWLMNAGGYSLGALLIIKLAVRRFKGHRPPRWDSPQTGDIKRARLTAALAILTAAIPAYCLISALNARATYHREMLGFEYHDYIQWLPATFDSASTWFVAWCSVALAFTFWSIRDWLLGKSTGEERAERLNLEDERSAAAGLPVRWRRLLWVLTINGGLLALEGIVQRLANCPRLLFIVLPAIHQTADTQFGPYAYRSNAAQYFNLLWPASVGLWWTTQSPGAANQKARFVPLICAGLMAACPIIASTRGGALIAVGLLLVLALFAVAAPRCEQKQVPATGQSRRLRTGWVMGTFLACSLALGLLLGWKTLKPRMAQFKEGYEYRERMYQNAQPMAADYPIYGIGPGAFVYVFQLYRVSTSAYWPPELHNDWLETRISFGWLGSAMIASALAIVGLSWFFPRGLVGHGRLAAMLGLGLGGCLIHARFDFPFQVYSVVFLFLIWCAMIVSLSRKTAD